MSIEEVSDVGHWRVTLTLTTDEGRVIRASRAVSRDAARSLAPVYNEKSVLEHLLGKLTERVLWKEADKP